MCALASEDECIPDFECKIKREPFVRVQFWNRFGADFSPSVLREPSNVFRADQAVIGRFYLKQDKGLAS